MEILLRAALRDLTPEKQRPPLELQENASRTHRGRSSYEDERGQAQHASRGHHGRSSYEGEREEARQPYGLRGRPSDVDDREEPRSVSYGGSSAAHPPTGGGNTIVIHMGNLR